MKTNYLIIVLLIVVMSCKQKEREAEVVKEHVQETVEPLKAVYPKNISKIFDAHGGLEQWNAMQSLSFTMPKPDGEEVTITNLKSRKSLINMPKHSIGFDGENVWVQNKDTTSYKGYDAKFYHNLMFYFYAMPFVLADDGIVYSETTPLSFEGVDYPGIKISYNAGVGESPEDEYILYYHPENHRMEWLGYTVTYFSKEKGKEFHFRRYNDWTEVNGLLLPKSIVRYKYENNAPTTIHSTNEFTDVVLSEIAPDDGLFKKPEEAKIIE